MRIGDGVSYGESPAFISFHIPVIATGWVVLQASSRYRKGAIPFKEARRNVGHRTDQGFGAAEAGLLPAGGFSSAS